MKRIRKIIRFGFALLGVIVFNACDDFLEEEPLSDITAENFINANNADQLVVGIYNALRPIYSDYTFKFAGTDLFAEQTEAFALTPENDYFNLNSSLGLSVWANNYRVIGRSNIVINRFLNEINFNDSQIGERDLGVAQARALRALAYFNLVQQYGGVPLELEEQTTIRTDFVRATEAEVYAQIIIDLEAAIPVLEESPEPGRFSSRAAQHLLSEVFLTRAYTSFAESNDFSTAASLAEAAIGAFDIRSQSFAEVFDIDNQINPEILFAVQWGIGGLAEDSDNNKHSIFMNQVFQYPGVSRTGNIYGVQGLSAQPTNFFYSLFSENDTREDVTLHRALFADVETLFDPDGDGPIPSDLILPGDTVVFYPRNFLDPADLADRLNRYFVYQPDQYEFGVPDNVPGTTYQFSANILRNNFPIFEKFDDTVFDETVGGARDTFVFRVAGTHLLAAEAYFGAGNTAQALFHLNIVRERATGIANEFSTVDIDIILDERARELAGEANRWAVLKRTGQLEQRINIYNPQVVDHGAFDSSIHLLRPIPAFELQLSEGSLQQNPGY